LDDFTCFPIILVEWLEMKKLQKNRFKKVKITFQTNNFDLKPLIIDEFVLQEYLTFGHHYYMMRLNFVSDQFDEYHPKYY
jgi:hypothetical protein